MDNAIWYFGFLHLLLYAGIGFSFVVYVAFRIIPRISRIIWEHSAEVLPRYPEAESDV